MSLLGDFGLCDPRLISDGNNDGCVNVQDLMLLLNLFGTDYFCSGHGTRGLPSDPCLCADFLDSNGVSVGAPWGGENCQDPPGGSVYSVGSNFNGQFGIGTVGGQGGYGQPACIEGGQGCGIQAHLVKAGPCEVLNCAVGCNENCNSYSSTGQGWLNGCTQSGQFVESDCPTVGNHGDGNCAIQCSGTPQQFAPHQAAGDADILEVFTSDHNAVPTPVNNSVHISAQNRSISPANVASLLDRRR